MHLLTHLISASYGIEMYCPLFDNWSLSSSHSPGSPPTPWELLFSFHLLKVICLHFAKSRKYWKVQRSRRKYLLVLHSYLSEPQLSPGKFMRIYRGYTWELNISTISEMEWDVYMCISSFLCGKMRQSRSNSGSQTHSSSG